MFTLLNFTVYFEARRRRGVATIAVAMTVVLSVSSMRVRRSKLLPLAACLHLYGGADRILVCGGLPELWSRSRRLGLETVSRRTNVSSRSRLEKNSQRLGLGHLRLVPENNFNSFLMGMQMAPYAV